MTPFPISPEALRYMIAQFEIAGEIETVQEFGSGNINDTFLSRIRNAAPRAYIHQRINKTVFPSPEKVIVNMAVVTCHIKQKLRHHSPPPRKTVLDLVPTKEGKLYYIDADGDYWRTTIFISDVVVHNTIQNLDHAYEVGKLLGEFQQLVADIPPDRLHDTLPGFHHAPKYYEKFEEAVNTPHPEPVIEARKQDPDALELRAQIHQREELVSLLMDLSDSGTLHERVVHNDPKVNNMLLDTDTRKGVCMIDLDTVKSGLIHFDYGDCLRYAANPAGEKIRDLRQVRFDLDIFESLTRGYLEEARAFLSDADVAYLTDAIKVMTYELVIRFLTDYLKGDVYFRKITSPTQNLHRAKVQFAVLRDIEAKEREIRQIMHALVH